MSNYLENLKWLVPSPISNKSDKIENKKNDVLGLESELDSESSTHSDSDAEYDKITVGFSKSDKNSQVKSQIQTKSDYSQIYSDLMEKEQLVRESLDPNTVDRIKANYTEYLDSDVKIIKDFAGIMENFVHIKEQLRNFESDIKEFEQNIRTSNLAQISENKSELDEKINQIDEKIERLSNLMTMTNGLVDDYIDKITQLENSIKENETHRQEIMLRLENFDKEHIELKNNNIKFFSIFNDYQKHFAFVNPNLNNWINYSSLGLIGIGLAFCIKFGLDKLLSKSLTNKK